MDERQRHIEALQRLEAERLRSHYYIDPRDSQPIARVTYEYKARDGQVYSDASSAQIKSALFRIRLGEHILLQSLSTPRETTFFSRGHLLTSVPKLPITYPLNEKKLNNKEIFPYVEPREQPPRGAYLDFKA